MNPTSNRGTSLIRHVIVYRGHEHPLRGPYSENVTKQIEMFKLLNWYRAESRKPSWEVSSIEGERLVSALDASRPEETLLVIPAGQSTHLDTVFSNEQNGRIQSFLEEGGRGYFTCGSSYWVAQQRIYNDVCMEQPETSNVIIKESRIPLFKGTAKGPLCPFPGRKYRVGFFSDAVRVSDGEKECSMYLGGGGSFCWEPSIQKIKTLIRYLPGELRRLGKEKLEGEMLDNAVVLASVGKGVVLLSMLHPYYGEDDIDVDVYTKAFPDCGTDWQRVKNSLGSLDQRMRFVLNSMLSPLEDEDRDCLRSLE